MKQIIETAQKNMTGSAIKRYREQANMTQAELSHQLETVAVYVCRGSIPPSNRAFGSFPILSFTAFQRC